MLTSTPQPNDCTAAHHSGQTARVLMLVENNGYPRDFRVRREAQALRDAGYRVSVICPREGTEPWTECHEGVAVYRFPAPPGGKGPLTYAFEFGYATAVMLLLAIWVALRRGVDVVHAANPPDTLFLIGALFRLFGKRYVFDHHDLAPELYLSRIEGARPNLIHTCLRLLERSSYAVADVVIATNDSYRQRAIGTGRKNPDKVFVVRNGPPLSYQLPAPPEDQGEPMPTAGLVGYIGTIGPQDGVDYLLRAIAHIVHGLGRDDVRAIVIGDGDALAQLQCLAHDLKIERHVRFTGWLSEPDARRCLSVTDVCVQPDPSSPLNDRSTMNKVMEYMALGKPLVAFDLVETRISAGEAGLYATPNDETELAEKICWLLDRPAEARRLGTLARERLASQLAWEHQAPQLLRAYADGLGLRPQGSGNPVGAAEWQPTDGAQTPADPPSRQGVHIVNPQSPSVQLPTSDNRPTRPPYALITPARNEASLIEQTILSVIAQTVLPIRWVIVSDGSTDGTDAIVSRYASIHPWMQLVRRPERVERNFAGKVHAFNAGYAALAGLNPEVIGNLDADITFDPTYFEFILDRFAQDPRLGVAGTPYLEGTHQYDYRYANIEFVSGACQMFRRACFEDIGGYQPLRGGGIDWVAVTTARMKGWRTRTFREQVCHHHRPSGTAQTSKLSARFRLGAKDHALGGHPLWEVFRGLHQMTRRPRVIGGVYLLAGYAWAWLSRAERTASPDLIRFHRQEQLRRLRSFLPFQQRPQHQPRQSPWHPTKSSR